MKLPVSAIHSLLHTHWIRTAVHTACVSWVCQEVGDVVRAKAHRELRQPTAPIRRTIKQQTEESCK